MVLLVALVMCAFVGLGLADTEARSGAQITNTKGEWQLRVARHATMKGALCKRGIHACETRSFKFFFSPGFWFGTCPAFSSVAPGALSSPAPVVADGTFQLTPGNVYCIEYVFSVAEVTSSVTTDIITLGPLKSIVGLQVTAKTHRVLHSSHSPKTDRERGQPDGFCCHWRQLRPKWLHLQRWSAHRLPSSLPVPVHAGLRLHGTPQQPGFHAAHLQPWH